MNEGGVMRNMSFSNIIMRNVPRPVFMTFNSWRTGVDSPQPPPPWGKLTGRAADGGYRLFPHVFSWPGNGQLVLPGVTSLPRKGFVLESGFVLKTEAKDGGLVVGLPPGGPPDERATVVVLEFDSNPARK